MTVKLFLAEIVVFIKMGQGQVSSEVAFGCVCVQSIQAFTLQTITDVSRIQKFINSFLEHQRLH